MSEKKFTDGPWKFIERPNLDRLIVDEHGYTICFISRLAGPVTVQKANARLISAAPKLLKALEFVCERISEECSDPYILDTVEQMEEAIAEAYGD